MRNKIFTILGILLVIATVGSYFLFDINIKQNSEAMGVDILIARTNIPEGTVIRRLEDANKFFVAKRIAQSDAVPSSIRVRTVKKDDGSFLDKIKSFFTVSTGELEVAQEDLMLLLNKRITTNIYKNQQVLSIYLSDDIEEFDENERLFAVPTSYIDSVGAEISKDDYVDLWVQYGGNHERKGTSEKIIEALRVVKVKGANNEEIDSNSNKGNGNGAVPNLVIFKMTEEQIAVVRQKMHEGTLFLTKWGRKPSTEAKIVLEEIMKESEEQQQTDEGPGIEEFVNEYTEETTDNTETTTEETADNVEGRENNEKQENVAE